MIEMANTAVLARRQLVESHQSVLLLGEGGDAVDQVVNGHVRNEGGDVPRTETAGCVSQMTTMPSGT